MKITPALLRAAAVFATTILVVFGFTACAQNLTHAPVYRGQYYAFDAYPHGYNGYPGFPYHGAPFGYGGPAFAATAQYRAEESGKEVRTTRTSTWVRHSATEQTDATATTARPQ